MEIAKRRKVKHTTVVVEAENARKCMYHKFSKEATLTVV
jgi:hypothetical protein